MRGVADQHRAAAPPDRHPGQILGVPRAEHLGGGPDDRGGGDGVLGVYQALDRLVRDGLARAAGTAREAGRPERTVYEITEEGTTAVHRWLVSMLPTPAREFPEFPVALALLAVLGPAQTRELLQRRIETQTERLAELRQPAPPGLPRLFLIEDEYRAAMLDAEIGWLRGVVRDLADGTLTWDLAMIKETAERMGATNP